MQHQLLHAIQIGGYIVIWFICPITHFSPEQQLIGMKFCMVIDQNVLCVFSYFRTTAPVASKWRAKHRLVRPVGLDISTAAAAEKSKRKISKNSPKILKSKFRKSVPQFFCIPTQIMCAKFHENQTKTVKVAKEIVFHRPSARHSLPIPLIGIEQVLSAKLLGVIPFVVT